MKRSAFLFLAAFCAGPALAGDGSIRASYDVAVKGVNIMKLRYEADLTDTSYSASLNAKTTGMAKWLSEYKIGYSSSGSIAKGKFVIESFARERKKNGKKSGSGVAWNAGVPAIDPDEVKGAARAQQAVSTGSTDPLAMLLTVGLSTASNPCKGKFRIFDGRDVMDTTLSGAAGGDGTIACKLSAKTIAGKSYENADDKNNVIDVYRITFKSAAAPFLGRDIFMPVEISGNASGQAFIATLEGVEITGASTN